MAKHKGDIEIGRRMEEEVYRVFGSHSNAISCLECGKNALSEWRNGGTPGGHMLAMLHYFGGDVIYVLTGKKERTLSTRKCKVCGREFASTNPKDEICYPCENALKRLNGYAVPVVRCKDCCNCTKSKWCNLLMMNVKDDWYCSNGKRVDEGNGKDNV